MCLGLACVLYFCLLTEDQLQFFNTPNFNGYYIYVCACFSKCTYVYIENNVLPQGNTYASGKNVYTKGLTCCYGNLINFFMDPSS